jgi:hypothetical protein
MHINSTNQVQICNLYACLGFHFIVQKFIFLAFCKSMSLHRLREKPGSSPFTQTEALSERPLLTESHVTPFSVCNA